MHYYYHYAKMFCAYFLHFYKKESRDQLNYIVINAVVHAMLAQLTISTWDQILDVSLTSFVRYHSNTRFTNKYECPIGPGKDVRNSWLVRAAT